MKNTTDCWLSCEWDNSKELVRCRKCQEIPDKIYYRQDKPGSTTGDYWCRKCAETTEQEIVDE